MTTKHLLDRTPIESTLLAVCISLAGLAAAAQIVRQHVSKAIDRALEWAEPL